MKSRETAARAVELVAIVNSFNRRALLPEALGSLCTALESLPMECGIVVFEANSSDGSREWLEEFSRQPRTIPVSLLNGNPGQDNSFSAGVNAACSRAAALYPGLKWFLLFETDNCLRSSEPLAAAIALLEREPRLAAAGFTVRMHNGASAGFGSKFPTVPQFMAGPQICHWLNWGTIPATDRQDSDWIFCDVVYTSPLLIRRVAWEQSQGFDAAEFPFADCDVDWAWRLHQGGWRLAVLRTDAVIHDNREQLSAWSGNRTLAFHRARIKLLRRHRGPAAHWIKPMLFARHLVEFGAVLLLAPRLRHPAASAAQRLKMLRRVWHGYV